MKRFYSGELAQYAGKYNSLVECTDNIIGHFIRTGETLEDSLFIIAKNLDKCRFSRFIKNTWFDLSDVFEKLDTNDYKILISYFYGDLHRCKTCGKYTLREFCSLKCAVNNPEYKARKDKTCLERYGTTNPVNSEEVKHKIAKNVKRTVQKRYGVDNISQLKSTKDKMRSTMLEKYGAVTNLITKEGKEKTRKTLLEKYGVEHPSQIADFRAKQAEKTYEKYGFPYYKNPDINEETLKSYIVNGRPDITKFCNDFKMHPNTFYRLLKHFDIEFKSSHKSQAELDLFNYIQDDSKKANDKTLIPPFEVDIAIPNKKLAIEYDGVYWHSDEYRKPDYHLLKTQKCHEAGYQLFHIFDTDNLEIWKSVINNKLNLSTKIYARSCIIKEIDAKQCKDFLNENHLQGSNISAIRLGLFYNDELVEAMTFAKPRFNKHYQYELIRLCTKKGLCVIGGASKLFKHFVKVYNPQSVISYANLRWSNGAIYEKLGFEYKGNSGLNYFYYKDGKLYSRNNFQKYKLKNKLKVYDENLTEYENMRNNGYSRIYDCGNMVFAWHV